MRRDATRSASSQRTARPPGQRQLRVGEELRHALAWTLERGDIRDPALAGRPVTVTEVRVSPDLRNATVYVVPLGGGDMAEAEVLAGFKRVKSFLRHELAHKVNLRHVPDLTFAVDETFDTADRIEAILHRPDVARDLDRDHPDRVGDGPAPEAADSGRCDGT
ncbi:30S ribosome-binding factor RbfA [Roseospira visakhapatnamensis]|uniref:Ribosome-binding factor A n=1 Tax=Roseospira visakhapatnamensis TaxID=390880 RepID=A0A7W6R9P9_9PROT|nr:30S ribosome-binding factor RbfA [Roseospira visakhapatnamensis]MBB4264504.1 ribosome-binding factor A [Roseospira visakhapatnamensis]